MEERDRDRIVELHALAFQVPEYRLIRQRRLALDEGWVVSGDDGVVYGGLRAEALGQYFGRRSVPSALVSAVKVAPEARGAGFGRSLMVGVLQALRERGLAVSVLYPSTPGVYRSVGYETAGASVRYRLAPGSLPRARGLPVRAWRDADLPAIEACYRRFASGRTGLVDRSPAWWSERVLDPYLDRPTQRYLVEDANEVVGYFVTGHAPAHGVVAGADVTALDFVWTTPAAARTLLGFGSALGPLTEWFVWPGGSRDPLATMLDSRPLVPHETWPWMLRILDLDRALEARGYPDDLTGTVELDCVDPVLPPNAGARRIEFAHGRATVEPIARAETYLDIRGFAALYTGWHTPAELADIGLLDGASSATLALLGAAFRSPDPWMVEVF
jgi:predicted acetyltransferase